MGLFHHRPETHIPDAAPVNPEAAEKITLYQELGALIEEAETLPDFPGEKLGAAISEYETSGKLAQFSKSTTNIADLHQFVDQFRVTVERYRPLSTVH